MILLLNTQFCKTLFFDFCGIVLEEIYIQKLNEILLYKINLHHNLISKK